MKESLAMSISFNYEHVSDNQPEDLLLHITVQNEKSMCSWKNLVCLLHLSQILIVKYKEIKSVSRYICCNLIFVV